MAFVPGQRLRASDLNVIGKLVGRNSRTSNSTSSTGTAVSVLSVRAPVTAGRSYLCTLQSESFGSVAANNGQHEVRYTTNDVEPTTSSTVLFRCLVTHSAIAIPVTAEAIGIFDCTTTGYLRLLHTISRTNGTGNATVSAGSANPEILSVEDIGDTIASTGTTY